MALILILSSAVPAFAAHPFKDVSAGKWYTPYVEYVYENNLMNGTTNTTFAPNANMNRAMVVTVLHRLVGEPASSAFLPFTDVPSGQYYTNAVRWCYEKGIVNGISQSIFGPKTDITREQLVTILYRYAQALCLDTSARANLSVYSDRGKIGAYASDAFRWAVSVGIITGTSSTALSPKGNATRAQCAAILQRFIGWVSGDPAMPAGSTLVSNPQNFSACNRYSPTNALQEITYWSNYTVSYDKAPNVSQVTKYTLNGMDKATAIAYVEMLQRNGYSLVDKYSLKNLYSWGLVCDRATNIPLIGQTFKSENGNSVHVDLWHYSGGWFLYVSTGLTVTDLGLRMNSSSIADRTPSGESADAGLLRLSDGRYQTTDGRLTTSLGYATVIQDGQRTTNSVAATLSDSGTLQMKVLTGGDTLIRFDYENGSLHKNSTLRRQEIEADGNPSLRVLMGKNLRELENSSKYLRQCTVRIMEQTSQVIVYYIYASLNGSPEEIEALCAIRVSDIETPQDREEAEKDNDNNNNSSSTPDHDNDYGSALTCTACRGSGRCSKCGGDGKIWSSAAGKENRNCTKCNASGRCQTCGGSGKRYN